MTHDCWCLREARGQSHKPPCRFSSRQLPAHDLRLSANMHLAGCTLTDCSPDGPLDFYMITALMTVIFVEW